MDNLIPFIRSLVVLHNFIRYESQHEEEGKFLGKVRVMNMMGGGDMRWWDPRDGGGLGPCDLSLNFLVMFEQHVLNAPAVLEARIPDDPDAMDETPHQLRNQLIEYLTGDGRIPEQLGKNGGVN